MADQAADAELGKEPEPPLGDDAVGPVTTVRELVVEDRFEGFRGVVPGPFVADVGSTVCVGFDKIDAAARKGAVTLSE